MVSDKLKSILFSKDAPFTPEQLAIMTDAEAWAWVYKTHPPKTKRNADTRPQICFTGFGEKHAAELKELAAKHFHVSSGVTVSLKYLITGPDPGPKKLEQARAQKTTIITEAQFLNILDTGELL